MNKKEIRLYGAGGHSQVVREILEDNGYVITETFDDKPEGSHYATKKIASGARDNLNTFKHDGPPVIIAVGINKDRAEIANFLKCKFDVAIHKSTIIANSAKIGEGTVVIAGAIINPNSVVGKHVLVNTAASIGHDCVVGNYAHISPKAALCGHVEVGEGSHIGVGAVVIPKVKIGKWCTVGAGTVVIRDIPDYSTVVGNPGKIIKRNLPENYQEEHNLADLTFIGSGISSSFTLLNYLNLIDNEDSFDKIKIDIIEKSGEFFTGIPYGFRSGFSVLLITSLRDFLPEPELTNFIFWLNNNKKWLLDKYRKEGGKLSEKWLKKHSNEIENNDWKDLFIPRAFFGKYLQEKLKRKIELLEIDDKIEVKYITDKVVDINKNDNDFSIKLKNQEDVKSKRIILSIGSLPIKYIFGNKSLIENENLLLVNNPYKPNLTETLNKIVNFTNTFDNSKKINVLIVGTNASGLELLYKLNDDIDISERIDKFTFLSTQGLIPNATVDEERKAKFIPKHLISLESESKLTAKIIADAAFKDLDYAEEIQLGAASTVGKISKAFGTLLSKLDEIELKEFACKYGNEIGRRQRCAGEHYLNTIDKLIKEKRFNHIAGRFSGLIEKNGEFFLKYLDTKTKQNIEEKEPIHLIINCIGSMRYNDDNAPSIIKTMIDKNFAIPNSSSIGFDVNSNFEASDKLHIMGPLLAGNIIDQKPIWHVEHCGRIIWLSNLLAQKIYNTQLSLITNE